MSENKKESANKQYLNSLFDETNDQPQTNVPPQEQINAPQHTNVPPTHNHGDVPPNNEQQGNVDDLHYTNVSLDSLPSHGFYKSGTKIKIRAAKVYEIQAYSVVDDKNFLDVTEKMNELLSRNIIYIFPNGGKGSYKDIKDSDRIFLVFMIRELTFQGGNTLSKSVQCKCGHKFDIPYRATTGRAGKATFDLHKPSDKISRFYKQSECAYELVHEGVSWKLAPPTIGIQESFYDEIKRNVQSDIKPDVAFMKVTPFLLYDRNTITEDGIAAKMDDFIKLDDMKLSQGINTLINNMTVGIKGLQMDCAECGLEVRTDLTFPNGASTLFELPNILDEF